ncbi:hypothetical protein D3C73_1216880 [compost metagenome]
MSMGFSPFDGGFNFLFTLIPIFIVIIFIVVIVGIISSGARYVKNSSSPRESRFTTISSKRMDVRHHTTHHDDNFAHSSSSRTYYYITLEFDNGERREYLDVKNIYGLVREGDSGYAATQGDWIVAFERSPGHHPSGGVQF